MRYGMGVTSVWVWGLCLAEAWTMCFTMGVVGAVEERGTVKGLVVGEGGQPIAGARVRALRISDVEPFDPFSPDLHAETDSVGRFEAQLRPGEYIAVVTKGLLTSDGAPQEARTWEVKAGGTLEVRIPLR
ncbi:MAG: carboxypeptidase regulatory-like domain-containing protein, partial [Planctomycetes bacterium]|nr:carboxypeptidase regulatory-like domain-containing protein [Planctomycetota bacterium]